MRRDIRQRAPCSSGARAAVVAALLTGLLVGVLAVFLQGNVFLGFEYAKTAFVAGYVALWWLAVLVAGSFARRHVGTTDALPAANAAGAASSARAARAAPEDPEASKTSPAGATCSPPVVPQPLWLLGAALAYFALVTAVGPSTFNGSLVVAKWGLVWALALAVWRCMDERSVLCFGRAWTVTLVAIAGLTVVGRQLEWDRSGLVFQGPDLSLTLGSSNFLGCFLVTCFPIVLATAFHEARTMRRAGWLAAALVVFALLAATGSRNALFWGLATGTGLCLALWRWCDGRSWRAIAARVVALALVLFALAMLLNPTATMAMLGRVQAVAGAQPHVLNVGRRYFAEVALGLWAESPRALFFGHGAGSYFPLANSFPAELTELSVNRLVPVNAHNEFLELLVEGGLVGFLLVAAGVGWVLLGLLRNAADASRTAFDRRWALAALAGLVGFLGFSVVEVASRYVADLAAFGVVLGLGLRFGGRPRPRPATASSVRPAAHVPPMSPIPRVLRALLGSLVPLALALACLGIAVPKLMASRLVSTCQSLRVAALPGQDRSVAARAELLGRALSWNRDDVEAHYERLHLAVQTDSLDDARAAFQDVQRVAPYFFDAHGMYADMLALHGDARGAVELLADYLAVHRFDMVVQVQAASLAVVSGDSALVTHRLAELLLATCDKLRLQKGLITEAALVESAEGRVVRIDLSSGKVVMIREQDLPWLLVREPPQTKDEAQRLIVEHLGEFISEDLGVGRMKFMRELREVLVEGLPRRWR